MILSAGSYLGDDYRGDQWPDTPSQPQFPVRGAKGGKVSVKGDRRPGVTVMKL
jgi:formylmethanofuran dehydrogenase subunit C